MNGLIRAQARRVVVFLAVLGFLASTASAAPGVLTNGASVTGLSGAQDSEVFYVISVPSGQDELVISITGGTGDCDLYVRKDAEPTLTNYDYRPYKMGNEETVTVISPEAGDWYIMLHAYQAYSGVTLTASYSGNTGVEVLTSGVPVADLSGTTGSELYFSIDVPSGQSQLVISISGGSGDCDLYVKKDSLPTLADWDYRPFKLGNKETVDITNPDGGTWYIMLQGYTAYAGVTLLGVYDGGVGIVLTNGVPVTDLSGAMDSEVLYRIEVPADQNNLDILMTNGTGDCDLYVQHGEPPTLTEWDYRPYLISKDEDVWIVDPNAGIWYIMLHGASAYTDVALEASYDDVVELEDEVPVEEIVGELDSEWFFKIDVPSGKNTLEISIAEGLGNCDLYVRYGAKPTLTEYDYRPYKSGNEETVRINGPEPGTWYIMLQAREAYEDVTLVADYWFSGSVTLLGNGVPETDLSDGEDGEQYFRLVVPSGQDVLEIAISGGTGDADLYVKLNAIPTTKHYDYRPYQLGNEETVTIEKPEAGDYLIMIRGYEAYSGLALVAEYGMDVEPGDVIVLTNGLPETGLAGDGGSMAYYQIDVPSGQASLEITTDGGTGDVDLYVSKEILPTTTVWEYRSFQIGNDERIEIDEPEAGSYYILLNGYYAYSGVTLVATYTPVVDDVVALDNGTPVPDLTAKAGDETFYKIVVPSGQDLLNVTTTGGTGDVDLYVRKGAKPSTSTYDYRSNLKGNDEAVEVTTPAAAVWYIMLYAEQAYAGVTLEAAYGVTAEGNVFTNDPNCVALWQFETGGSVLDSIGLNTLTNNGAELDNVTFQEGNASMFFSAHENDWMTIGDDYLGPEFPTKSTDTDVEMSICFWMNPATFSFENTIMSKYLIATGDRSWRIFTGYASGSAGMLKIGLGTGSGSSYNTYAFDEEEQFLTASQWYHVAFTYRDSDRSYHVRVWDAEADELLFDVEGTANAPIAVNDAPLVLGDLPLQSRPFDGWLDEVVFFKSILTSDDIDAIRQGSYGHGKL